jgi:hypothetical protein
MRKHKFDQKSSEQNSSVLLKRASRCISYAHNLSLHFFNITITNFMGWFLGDFNQIALDCGLWTTILTKKGKISNKEPSEHLQN